MHMTQDQLEQENKDLREALALSIKADQQLRYDFGAFDFETLRGMIGRIVADRQDLIEGLEAAIAANMDTFAKIGFLVQQRDGEDTYESLRRFVREATDLWGELVMLRAEIASYKTSIEKANDVFEEISVRVEQREGESIIDAIRRLESIHADSETEVGMLEAEITRLRTTISASAAEAIELRLSAEQSAATLVKERAEWHKKYVELEQERQEAVARAEAAENELRKFD